MVTIGACRTQLALQGPQIHVDYAEPGPDVSQRIDTLLTAPDAYKGYRLLRRLFIVASSEEGRSVSARPL
jgi:hypothetical protein